MIKLLLLAALVGPADKKLLPTDCKGAIKLIKDRVAGTKEFGPEKEVTLGEHDIHVPLTEVSYWHLMDTEKVYLQLVVVKEKGIIRLPDALLQPILRIECDSEDEGVTYKIAVSWVVPFFVGEDI